MCVLPSIQLSLYKKELTRLLDDALRQLETNKIAPVLVEEEKKDGSEPVEVQNLKDELIYYRDSLEQHQAMLDEQDNTIKYTFILFHLL